MLEGHQVQEVVAEDRMQRMAGNVVSDLGWPAGCKEVKSRVVSVYHSLIDKVSDEGTIKFMR